MGSKCLLGWHWFFFFLLLKQNFVSVYQVSRLRSFLCKCMVQAFKRQAGKATRCTGPNMQSSFPHFETKKKYFSSESKMCMHSKIKPRGGEEFRIFSWPLPDPQNSFQFSLLVAIIWLKTLRNTALYSVTNSICTPNTRHAMKNISTFKTAWYQNS